MEYGFATPFAASQKEVDYDFLLEIKRAGYDYVELPGTLVGALDEQDFLRLTAFLSDIELSCKKICALLPAGMNCFTTEARTFRLYIDRLFDRFKHLNVEGVGFGSGAAREIPQNWDPEKGKNTFTAILQDVFLPHLAANNMMLCIEPLRKTETNLISTVAEAAAVVKDLNDCHFGIVADTLHMITMQEDPEDIASTYMPLIQHFHISELERYLPVTAFSDPCRAFIKAFLNCGYDKTVSYETKCRKPEDLESALKLIQNI